MTRGLMTNKRGIQTLPAAFTDHNVVELRITTPTQATRGGWRRWKMNPHTMDDERIKMKIRQEYERWKRCKQSYPDVTSWWERCVKRRLTQLLRRAEAESRADCRKMEEHLYQCIYDILRSEVPEEAKFLELKKYKAKIVRLHAERREKLMLDAAPHDKMEGEEPTLYHILKRNKRREAREIRTIKDPQGNTHTSPKEIQNVMVAHLTQKYNAIAVEEASITIMTEAIPQTCPAVNADQLECPITYDEIVTALKTGAHHKAPGIDGLGLEWYTANWDTIKEDLRELLNQMFLHKQVTPRQKQGIVVCLPKSLDPKTPDDYRPITLLTTEYKLLARIMARRLQPILERHLRGSQYCAVPGISILDALATIRDAIAYHETSGKPLCVITLDFESAFDRISHRYLFAILGRYGISQWFIERIYTLYDDAYAAVQINGSLTGRIPIRCAVRQGCPLSMILYALCLQPLLNTLEKKITGIYVGGTRCSPVVAYADDVTVLVTNHADLDHIHHSIAHYEKATGAKLNKQKSNALAIGNWTAPEEPLGIKFREKIKILGIEFGPAIRTSTKASWDKIVGAVRAQARTAYARELCLAKRIQYVQIYLLSKIWYVAQLLPPSTAHVQQLTTACAWYIWQGAPLRVPITTL